MPDVNSPPTTGAVLPEAVLSSAISKSVARTWPTVVNPARNECSTLPRLPRSSTTAIFSVCVPVASLRMNPEYLWIAVSGDTGVFTSRSIWLSINRPLSSTRL